MKRFCSVMQAACVGQSQNKYQLFYFKNVFFFFVMWRIYPHVYRKGIRGRHPSQQVRLTYGRSMTQQRATCTCDSLLTVVCLPRLVRLENRHRSTNITRASPLTRVMTPQCWRSRPNASMGILDSAETLCQKISTERVVFLCLFVWGYTTSNASANRGRRYFFELICWLVTQKVIT